MKKRILAMILCIASVLSVCTMAAITASAANYTTSYGSYSAPSGSDYAYWNGKKVCKASGTTTSEIKWMQAALNFCIQNRGLNASKLDVDGSFGPASKQATLAFQKKYNLSADGSFGPKTIDQMKKVLEDPEPAPAPSPVVTYDLCWPTKKASIVGQYGKRGSLRSSGTRYHSGIDIGVSTGSPCYAAADGVVVMCKSSDDDKNTIYGRGRYIVIYHSNGDFSTLYEHLNRCDVKKGDTVKKGQKIGTTGNSGWKSYGTHYDAHLHFGLISGKMTTTGYDLWTVPGKKYNGKTYTNHTIDPDANYNNAVRYTYQ